MTHEDYTVVGICALPLDAAASKVMLDKTHPQLSPPAGDDNAYTLGEISGHNIVIACLPSGVYAYGTIAASTVAANTFANHVSLHSLWLDGRNGRSSKCEYSVGRCSGQ